MNPNFSDGLLETAVFVDRVLERLVMDMRDPVDVEFPSSAIRIGRPLLVPRPTGSHIARSVRVVRE